MKSALITMIVSTLFATRAATAFVVRSPTASRAFSRTAVSMAENPKVFFDMVVGGQDVGRVTFELRADVVPKTGALLLYKYRVVLTNITFCLTFSFLHTLHFSPRSYLLFASRFLNRRS